ncbi:MAG: FkbM family methyltransferase [Desulfobacterales bacterium]|nr:FkbM family methyltransferase [Desulfobacterales bacterium]
MKDPARKQVRTFAEKREVREYFKNKKNGIFVEVGAHEPTSAESQSWHLEKELDWSGILVEPNPELSRQAQQLRPNATVYQCACTSPDKTGILSLYIPIKNNDLITSHASLRKNADDFSYTRHKAVSVEAVTLNSLLEKSGIESIDLLSIDVEGTEMEVMEGFDLKKFAPALILLEDKLLYLEKHRYLKNNGYMLVKRTKQNNWYIPKTGSRPPSTIREKIKLLKKLYISIWLRKIKFAIKSKSPEPLFRI